MKNRNKNFLKAYTLLEVLVVMAIIGITSSILLVDFSSGRAAEEVENVSREVLAVFRETQNNALSGYQVVEDTRPCRFQISWSEAAYTVTYWYRDGAGDCTQSSVMGSYALRNGVRFSAADNFSFDLPRAGVSFSESSKGAVLAKNDATYVVCTYTSPYFI